MKHLLKAWRWLIGDVWVPRRCCWPFPDGYCRYNKRRGSIDHGCTLESIRKYCKELNAAEAATKGDKP